MDDNKALQSGEYTLEVELKVRPYAASENVVVYVSDFDYLKRLHFHGTMGWTWKARRLVMPFLDISKLAWQLYLLLATDQWWLTVSDIYSLQVEPCSTANDWRQAMYSVGLSWAHQTPTFVAVYPSCDWAIVISSRATVPTNIERAESRVVRWSR